MKKNIILIFLVLIVTMALCKDIGNEMDRMPDKAYNIMYYLPRYQVCIAEINFRTGEEKVLKVFDRINKQRKEYNHEYFHLYTIDKNRVMYELRMGKSFATSHEYIEIFNTNKKTFKRSQENLNLYGYMKKHQLILGKTYENQVSKLALYDLNFEKKEFITDNISQLGNVVLDDDRFLISIGEHWKRKDGSEWYDKYWLYNVKTKEKKRLDQLSEVCNLPLIYRNKTEQLLCQREKDHILVDLEANKIEETKIGRDFSVIFYDQEEDIVFLTRDGVTLFGGWTSDLFVYVFKTKELIRLKKDFDLPGKGIDNI